MRQKTEFKHLSTPLKTSAIIGWIAAGIYALAFLIGFIQELVA